MTRAHPPAPERAQAPRTDPPEHAGPIHLVVDLNRCQAYAQCCFLAPEVFQLHGEEALWYDPAPEEAQREHVLRAVAACPVQAIVVERAEPASRHNRKHTEHKTVHRQHQERREEPHAAQRS